MTPFLCANWKMNLPPEGIASFVEGIGESEAVEVAIAPPFPFLGELSRTIRDTRSSATVAAQNCAEHDRGAFTGEVSAGMLRQAGATSVIVGHSERRTLYGESESLVGKKLDRLLAAGLRPIFCIGEEERTRQRGETGTLLARQIDLALAQLAQLPQELIVAYEPVWAIGTGRTATPAVAAETHREIRAIFKRLAPRCAITCVYGGSVTAENASSLAAEREIDGFLVGGASLESGRFRQILLALETAASERG